MKKEKDPLDDPLCLSRAAALLMGISIINDKCNKRGEKCTAKHLDGDALQAFVDKMGDKFFEANFIRSKSIASDTKAKMNGHKRARRVVKK